MQWNVIQQWLRALVREVLLHKWLVAFIFALSSLSVVSVGVIWPKQYASSGIVHADRQNIIAPLLQGSAEMTRIDAATAQGVSEVIYSKRIMEAVAKKAELLRGDESSRQIESILNGIRGGIEIEDVAKGYISIAYKSNSAQQSFTVVNAIIDAFIWDSAETKRGESKSAYQFIDRQVKTYKGQLQEAEEKLKRFKAGNLDGTEGSVNARIAGLRSSIEGMKLDLDDSQTRAVELKVQLKKESRHLARNFRADVYRERLSQAQSELETLRLSYQETYPDIVTLKHQIEDLKRAFNEVSSASAADSVASNEAIVNPLYQALRSQLADIEVDVRTRTKRLEATKRLLSEEYERAKRVAERQADLSELTRDYNVTRGIYEDMLERKERARLSMTLDIEGQGVSYKIQEPPGYPTSPTGLRFLHFAIGGLLLGCIVSIGLVAAYIAIDPRVRFTSILQYELQEELQIPVLGTIPHYATPVSKRVLRGDVILLGLFLTLVIALYAAILAIKYMGII